MWILNSVLPSLIAIPVGGLDAEAVPLTSEDYFERNVFMKIIDTLVEELARRTQVYNDLLEKFMFLLKFRDLPIEELRACDIVEEIVHFREFGTTGGDKHLNITNLCQFLIETNLVEVFPNIHVALRMYKSMAVSNCSSERSFSCLKRIKSYLG